MTTLDYYFYSPSPFSYLGHDALLDVARKHEVAINYKPVDLFIIWGESDAVPPAKRPLIRQKQRLIELQRLSEFRNLPLNKEPKFFPVDAKLADCSILALMETGANPHDYIRSVFQAVWAHEENIADDGILKKLLEAHGFDGSTIMQRANTEDIAKLREQNAHDALAVNAPGVPSYVLNGECFWGQDRIDHLDHALTTGRPPIQP